MQKQNAEESQFLLKCAIRFIRLITNKAEVLYFGFFKSFFF